MRGRARNNEALPMFAFSQNNEEVKQTILCERAGNKERAYSRTNTGSDFNYVGQVPTYIAESVRSTGTSMSRRTSSSRPSSVKSSRVSNSPPRPVAPPVPTVTSLLDDLPSMDEEPLANNSKCPKSRMSRMSVASTSASSSSSSSRGRRTSSVSSKPGCARSQRARDLLAKWSIRQ